MIFRKLKNGFSPVKQAPPGVSNFFRFVPRRFSIDVYSVMC
nr:MAG TPA: hypothetical protein [Caudoviricetes sp.]